MNNIYSTSLYNEISEIKGYKPFHLQLFNSNEPHNQIYGTMSNNCVHFGITSPFWLPNFIYQYSNIEKLEESFQDIVRQCKKLFIKEIKIRLAPHFYQNSLCTSDFLLKKMGFSELNLGIWQTIPLKNFSNKDHYVKSLKHSSRKVLKKFDGSSINLNEVSTSDIENIQIIYDLINNNRLKINTKLKYSPQYLMKLSATFPKNIRVFSLTIDQKLVAGAICHLTQKNILYVAAWGDYGHELEYSPMYCFATELVDLCLKEDIEYLDFGISSDLNLYTPKLHSFKQNIACESHLQNTLFLALDD